MKTQPSNKSFFTNIGLILTFLAFVYFCSAIPLPANQVAAQPVVQPEQRALTAECAWCHQKKHLNKHHIIPRSADPSLKDVDSNIIILCRECHFVLGHRRNWKRFNPDVVTVINMFTNDWSSKDYREMKAKEHE